MQSLNKGSGESMKKVTRKTAVLFSLLILFISAMRLYARDGINANAGFKIIYAKDENVLQNYYRAFAGAGWSDDYFDVYASYNRWISYSVTDELLNTMDVNIHQPALELAVYLSDSVSLDAGYSFFSGDSSYSAQMVEGGFLLDLEDSDISADFMYKDTHYYFAGDICNSSFSAGAELSVDINDKASWDIAYEFTRTDYSTFGNVYTRHTLRAGLVFISSVNCFVMGGFSGSADSANVVSAMFDAGLTVKLYDHVKLSGIYMFTADFYQSSAASGGGPSAGSAIESEISHTGSISVSLYL